MRKARTVVLKGGMWASEADGLNVIPNLNAKWGYTPIRDNNKVGSLTDPYKLNAMWGLKNDVGLCVGLRPVNLEIFADAIRANLNAKWGYTPIRDNNKVGSLTDPYSYSFSCALNFEEWT
ncbi:hypothetical protein V1477_011773 [Vespula maculifrons]|uniref:Uncharacterized protein n=1 Tax=Vespula maculifrons TaxID=7453 RepID=A0ABD2C056_VESMC